MRTIQIKQTLPSVNLSFLKSLSMENARLASRTLCLFLCHLSFFLDVAEKTLIFVSEELFSSRLQGYGDTHSSLRGPGFIGWLYDSEICTFWQTFLIGKALCLISCSVAEVLKMPRMILNMKHHKISSCFLPSPASPLPEAIIIEQPIPSILWIFIFFLVLTAEDPIRASCLIKNTRLIPSWTRYTYFTDMEAHILSSLRVAWLESSFLAWRC